MSDSWAIKQVELLGKRLEDERRRVANMELFVHQLQDKISSLEGELKRECPKCQYEYMATGWRCGNCDHIEGDY